MSDAFVGEVRAVGFGFAPQDWAMCDGRTLQISGYDALYSLIGTTYGGDGQANFALPNLQGRVIVHQDPGGQTSYSVGQTGGVEAVTLLVQNLPTHSHNLMVSSDNASSTDPTNSTLANGVEVFTDKTPNRAMSGAMIGMSTGGAQPHDNMQPYLVLNWVISLFGIFPTRG